MNKVRQSHLKIEQTRCKNNAPLHERVFFAGFVFEQRYGTGSKAGRGHLSVSGNGLLHVLYYFDRRPTPKCQ